LSWQLTVTVDEVEEATGMDFFGTMPKEEQDRLESALDFKAWGIGGRQAEKVRGEGEQWMGRVVRGLFHLRESAAGVWSEW